MAEGGAYAKTVIRVTDVADAAAWVAASRRGELPKAGAIALAGLHVAAIALGAAALATADSTG